ncbi:MAG TPA: cytochrome c oxidase subunit I [Bacillota bacterium]|nr:cytochrome c oxidase subunit I [Bacillota bacterium]
MAAVSERLQHSGARPRPGEQNGIWAWLTTVDHKRIGIMYLLAACVFLGLGGIEAFMMRLQLAVPNNNLVSAGTFNELFTMHGLTMIFLAVMPLAAGFMNYLLPLQIGARDVAFPRLNALSLWLFLAGGIILYTSWFTGNAPNAGWFNYAPLNSPPYSGTGIDYYVIGLNLAGLGSLISGINFLTTIVQMRAPGMHPMRLPMFVWTTVVTSLLLIFAMPAFTADLILLMFDRFFGTGFFNPAVGGNALLWQQLFWIFGHPEVYILIMPAFGIISEVVPTFSRKPLFGYASMVFAVMAIGFMSFMVWSHHMFADGYGPVVNSVFAITSMLISVPTGVKIFNWLATMWGGRIRFTTAMMFATAFVATFTIGGFSGVMLASAPADLQYNDSYFVVAHIHYVLVGGALMALFAAGYYWYPKMTGRLLSEAIGKWNFWLVFIGFNVTFFPFHLLGILGMPRRIFTYAANLGLDTWNYVATVGVFILAVGIMLYLVNLLWAWRNGAPAGGDPWDARTLEWATSSPPPVYNFATIPLVRGRDPLWVEKRTGNGQMIPVDTAGADEGSGHHGNKVHIPSPSALPLFLTLALTLAAYATLFHVWLLAGLGMLLMFFCLFRWMFDKDPGILVDPEGDAA